MTLLDRLRVEFSSTEVPTFICRALCSVPNCNAGDWTFRAAIVRLRWGLKVGTILLESWSTSDTPESLRVPAGLLRILDSSV